jgi:hypothetical protein
MSVKQQKAKNRNKNTQLIDVMTLPSEEKQMKEEVKRKLIFDPAVKGQIPGSSFSTYRINLGWKNPDGTEGGCVFDTDRCYSYGISEGKDQTTGALTGYSISLAMHDRESATEKQYRTTMFINAVSDIVKDHLLQEEVKDSVQKGDLDAADLKKINPLYLKKDSKGKVIPGSDPNFYPKLMYWKESEKNGKVRPANISSKFYAEDEYDENGDQLVLDPLNFLNVPCYAVLAIKLDSIFFGAKINIQCKVLEGTLKKVEIVQKRMLLRIGAPRTPQIITTGEDPMLSKKEEDVSVKENVKESKEPELVISDDEDESKKKKKVIRKSIKVPTK